MLNYGTKLNNHQLILGIGQFWKMQPKPLEIDIVLQDIEKALEARIYYIAIVMSLTIPDICGALESENGWATQEKYKSWYEKNLSSHYKWLTPDDLWRLRCGNIHQGRMGHEKLSYAKVIFTIPDGRGNLFHNNILNDALNLDTITFCRDMISAARDWFQKNQNHPIVRENLKNLVQLRPQGLDPYIIGVPVIA